MVGGWEGVRVVVVVGGAPSAGGVGGDDVVDLVYEHASPAFAGIGIEGSGAGLSAGLIAEDHGSVVVPAEGVGADEPLTFVVGDPDRPASL